VLQNKLGEEFIINCHTKFDIPNSSLCQLLQWSCKKNVYPQHSCHVDGFAFYNNV